MITLGIGAFLIVCGICILFYSVRFVRPTERGLIEKLGKYNRFAMPGLNLVFPFIERMLTVDITEHMVNADKREVITKDNLNAIVDAQIYYKVKAEEESVKKSEYNVASYENMIISLAQTTLRNVIGTLTLTEVNSERGKINLQLLETLHKEADNWGIDIVRAELKEVEPPKDVQEAMNMVVKAQNQKLAAVDFATAAETQADGSRRAAIKAAEGTKQAAILEAEGKAESIKLVNEAAEKYFVGNAQYLKQLEVTQESLKNNAKIILTEKGITPQLIIGTIPMDSQTNQVEKQ